MATIHKVGACVALAGILLLAGNAHALSPPDRCEASKLKTAGKYDFCRLNEESKAARTGTTPDFTKCDDRYSSKWLRAESGAGNSCPSQGDVATIGAFITQHTDDVAAELGGGSLPDCPGNLATCTNGLSTCNGSLGTCNGSLSTCSANLATTQGSLVACNHDLSACGALVSLSESNLTTCQAIPKGQRLKTGQTTCYDSSGTVIACTGTGQDGELREGLARSYVDNGDGTITDMRTGLMWEKLSDDGSIHDWNETYTWGDAQSVFIPTLNGGSFAGHNDWRLPNRSELESLADLGRMNPAIDPAFNTGCLPGCTVTTCSCTSVFLHYWSSTTNFWSPSNAWLVYFVDGDINAFPKTSLYHARAVRGGL